VGESGDDPTSFLPGWGPYKGGEKKKSVLQYLIGGGYCQWRILSPMPEKRPLPFFCRKRRGGGGRVNIPLLMRDYDPLKTYGNKGRRGEDGEFFSLQLQRGGLTSHYLK